MVAINDTEVSGPAAETASVTYPKIVVTGLNIVGADGIGLNGSIIFTPSAIISSPGLGVLIEGSGVGTVTAGVMAPVTLPTTDAVTPGFTYTITQRLLTPDGINAGNTVNAGIAIPRSLGPTVDISVLI